MGHLVLFQTLAPPQEAGGEGSCYIVQDLQNVSLAVQTLLSRGK